ncbi:uncharacterized protein LOC107044190 [Diachasma alloeum]|uniref:uncharacterized protein LOC107044190 n=1 Tax=Diachasma alloeum TaxID=454923 RepID=UPI00073810CB|nr:uncharacterized protein LOC107044190 [Diachasma alloeum]
MNIDTRNTDNVAIITRLAALPILPPDKIISSYKTEICDELTQEKKTELEGFLNYYESDWIKSVGPEELSCYQNSSAINASQRSILQILESFVKKDRTFWKFMERIIQCQEKIHKELRARPRSVSHPFTPRVYFLAEEHASLKKHWDKYQYSTIDEKRLLQVAAYYVKKSVANSLKSTNQHPRNYDVIQGEGYEQHAQLGTIFSERAPALILHDLLPRVHPHARRVRIDQRVGARRQPARGAPAQAVPARGAPARGVPARGAPARRVPVQAVPAQAVPVRGVAGRRVAGRRVAGRRVAGRRVPGRRVPLHKAPVRGVLAGRVPGHRQPGVIPDGVGDEVIPGEQHQNGSEDNVAARIAGDEAPPLNLVDNVQQQNRGLVNIAADAVARNERDAQYEQNLNVNVRVAPIEIVDDDPIFVDDEGNVYLEEDQIFNLPEDDYGYLESPNVEAIVDFQPVPDNEEMEQLEREAEERLQQNIGGICLCCHTNRVNFLFLDCRHSVMCTPCYNEGREHLVDDVDLLYCIVCRKLVSRVITDIII